MFSKSTFQKAGRAIVVAAALGASSLAAMPAQAASQPSLNFQLGIGNDGSVITFGAGRAPRGSFPIKKCLTNRQIERGLERHGFDDANVVRNLSNTRVLVRADWGRYDYSLKVNRCSGQVYDIERIRRAPRPDNNWPNHGWDDNNGNGFGFKFRYDSPN
jgi:hypothetical protein